MHETHSIAHGALREDNILVWTSGLECSVKIGIDNMLNQQAVPLTPRLGYIGGSMIQEPYTFFPELDSMALGEILLRIKEPTSAKGATPQGQLDQDWHEESLGFFWLTRNNASIKQLSEVSLSRYSVALAI
jgi:hypothetical protein